MTDALPPETHNSTEEKPKRAAANRLRFRIMRDDLLTGVLLVAILIFGAYLRFVGQNWDDFTHLHPDERFLTGVAEQVGMPALIPSDRDETAKAEHLQTCLQRYPDTNGVGGYFDALCSTMYPPNIGNGLYVYGELPLFIVHYSAQIVAQVTNNPVWLGYNGIHFVGRTMSAVAELFTILFVFLTARHLYGRRIGLLAALLYTVAVLPIQLAHFWTADAFSNFPIAVAFFFAARVLDRSRWYDYLGFGVGFGAALASRINTLPLVGIIVLAAIIYCLPIFDITIPWSERSWLLNRAARGLVMAGAATFVVFRLTNPHAFTGPSIFGIAPYKPFFDQIAEAQYETSGLFDIPPNYQWVNRPPYLFAWRNIVEWGLGLPLGLVAWGGWIWAGIQILRARKQWTRHVLLVTWILVYFGLLGKNWVATMRYYMPLYPALVTLGAWMLAELVKRAWRVGAIHLTPNPSPPAERGDLVPGGGVRPWRRLAQVAAVGVLIFVTGFSVLWGFGFTRIYTRLLTRGEASQWVLRNLPSAVSTTITLPDGRTRLFNVPYSGAISDSSGAPLQLQKKAPIGGTFNTVSFVHALDSSLTRKPTTLHVRVADVTTNSTLAEGSISADMSSTKTSPFGDSYTVTLNKPVQVSADQLLAFQLYSDGDAIGLTGTAIATEGAWDDPIPWKVCPIPAQMDLTHDTPSGLSSQTCEGVDGYGEGYYKGYELYMVAEDNDQKRETIQKGMDAADYITISSNRFYDTLPRDPARFPMTVNVYNALFAGQLGFDVYKTFTSYIQIGPFSIPDEILPTDNLPKWMNEWWESEEAFTVYDHPAVFILKKNASYNPNTVRAVLYGTNTKDQGVIALLGSADSFNSTQIANKVNWTSFQASPAPSAFMMSPEQSGIQRQGGTWSELFNRDSPLNTSPLLVVVVWYGLLLVFGFITWPLLFVILPGLPDRGYPIAKLAGLLIVSFLVWAGGTLNLLTWSAPGILGAMIALAVFSGVVAWRRRVELFSYIRTHRRHFLIVEAVTLTLFVGFLLVRLGNPDLWAQVLGGEKPMDFSYFNAVLRSTVFPPYDPWYSGGYLNYYYFGYVLVGTPTKLLGVMPSIAYNLILPMLYAFTGIGAFSVAYNVVASRLFAPRDEGDSDPAASFRARRRWALRAPAGSPYIAGIAAAILCVVIGNLDTPRVFFTGVANAGGYGAQTADLYQNLLDDFIARNGGRAPTPEENAQLILQADDPSLFDQIRNSTLSFNKFMNSLGTGLNVVATQGYLPISPDRWFWGPSRVIGELPNASSEITEMPYFTFVYADLHAHMISMPLQLLALAWLLAEILGAGIFQRPTWVAVLATTFGALVVGLLYATNTWDWVTYMILALAGLTFAAFLRGGKWSRRPLLRWLGQLGYFVAAQQVFGLPFRSFFATGYSSASPFLGNKTPLWAYFDIHGVFLFILFSLLVWQTVRVLRRTYVRDLFRNLGWLLAFIAAFGAIILVTIAFTALKMNIFIFNPPYPVAIITLPMLGWALILFLLPDQSREMRMVLGLTILALALTQGAEMVVLANDTGRQNTIFKLYMQVWLLFGVAGGVALAWLLRASERWRSWLRSPWLAFAALLLSISALFPVMATQGKIAMRMAPQAPHTLNGLDYMKSAIYGYGETSIPLIDDYKLITWLQDNIKGTPVILEAQMSEYQLGSRIAMNTGLPTVLGYRYHQTQQRSLDPLPNFVNARMANVGGLYNTTDIDAARSLLRYYNIEYIIVGDLEKAVYTGSGLAKFDEMTRQKMLEIVYNNNGTRVYHVLPSAITLTDAMLDLPNNTGTGQ